MMIVGDTYHCAASSIYYDETVALGSDISFWEMAKLCCPTFFKLLIPFSWTVYSAQASGSVTSLTLPRGRSDIPNTLEKAFTTARNVAFRARASHI